VDILNQALDLLVDVSDAEEEEEDEQSALMDLDTDDTTMSMCHQQEQDIPKMSTRSNDSRLSGIYRCDNDNNNNNNGSAASSQ
jgi:DNA-directed RNA polymerase subunit M/transcription elongation factor TFIIS